jgi:hypothetical protein
MSSERNEAFNALIHPLREGLSLAQVRWELETSRQRVLDAIASATDRGLDASLYGEAGLRSTHESQHAGWIRRWREERGCRGVLGLLGVGHRPLLGAACA